MATPPHPGTTPSQSNVGKNSLPLQFRLVTDNTDIKFESLLDRVETAVASCLSTNASADISIVAQLVFLQDHQKLTSISLPVLTSPALLFREGRSYVCNPDINPKAAVHLLSQLDTLVTTMEPGKIRKESIPPASIPSHSSNLPADFVIYVPESLYHIRVLISNWRPSFPTESVRFNYAKDTAKLWRIDVCNNDQSGCVVLSLAPETLRAQFARMVAGQNHGFTLLVRDFLRNAITLAGALGNEKEHKDRLFFPGVFDLAADVKQHYNEKVDRFKSQDQSEAGGIRKFNNLVKSVLLSHFVPAGKSAYDTNGPIILDLACGHGQDLLKYTKKFPKLYIGIDISQAALNEARRRHAGMRFSKYPAN